ncbi:glycosyl transferase family 2 [Aliiruegeria haliotis]|uniref:Glycosyl transferase family 2 n=1 Tax=Aliiruegeria haliotis TaxID=1280846 RepID=A0A2T0RL17_9RHOB|nr:glycosyltransferase family 2 protein [Aliiruegeria haliotis]PRY21803.1 glycosyl transferase family 2 [Aliiruegeria haliotis]
MESIQRWAVVATVMEPTNLVLAFAAHHLGLGASEVHLFLDDPGDPCANMLRRLPRCYITRCDDWYWSEVRNRDRPLLQSQRQAANATWAYNRTEADWLLHIDADEFLQLDRPLPQILSRLGDEVDWLRIPNHERVWLAAETPVTIFDGVFRSPRRMPDDVYRRTPRGNARFLRRGLAGYPNGKSLSRTGRGLRIGAHAPHANTTGNHALPAGRTSPDARLLHFDGLTPLHWALKTLRYAAVDDRNITELLHPERQAQVRHVRDACHDLQAVLAFHRDLFVLDPLEADALRRRGALFRSRIAPQRDLAWLLPDHTPRFAPTDFDESLDSKGAVHLMQGDGGCLSPCPQPAVFGSALTAPTPPPGTIAARA